MTIFIAKGAWHDKRGVRHNFEIESDRAERRFIIELIGLIAFINFTRNNLITAEQRTALIEKVKSTYNQTVA